MRRSSAVACPRFTLCHFLTAWWRCRYMAFRSLLTSCPGRSPLDPAHRQPSASRHPPPAAVSAGRRSSVLLCFLSIKASLDQCYLFRLLSFHSGAFLATSLILYVFCRIIIRHINVLLPRYFLSPCTCQCENDITFVWGCSFKELPVKMTSFQR